MVKIILLNGPSSSGKSTLSRAIKTRLSGFEVVSIDDFMKLAKDETIYEDDVFEISADMCNRALELLRSGNGIIIDHVITSERIFTQLCDMLGGYEILKVKVACPVEILREREKARGDRCVGSAESSFTYLFPKDGYDIEVDTYKMTADECAEIIVCHINK